jgi:hypothetical protein
MNAILKPGKYTFQICNCDAAYIGKTSGKESIRIICKINSGGEETKIFEYFSKSIDPKTGKPWAFITERLNDLVTSIGKPYLIGTEIKADDLLDGVGYAIIHTEKSEQYGDKSRIAKFLPPTDTQPLAKVTVEAPVAPVQTRLPLEEDGINKDIDMDLPF